MGNYGQSITGKSRGNIQVGGDLNINSPPAPSAPSNWFTLNEDFIKRHQTLKESDLRNYLEGEHCKWALVIREQLAERPLLHRLLSAVREHDMVALLGPGAEGKTTLLMQTAYRLFRDGWTVFYFTGTRLLGDVPKATRETPCIYIADNAPLCDDLKAFLQTARRREWRVLLAGRQNEWNRYAHEHTLETRGLTALETEKTDRPEADAFAAYLSRQPFISAPEEELRNLFLNNSNGFLYAAMLEAVHGQPLEEIARDILHNIQPPNHENPTIIKTIALLCVMEGSYRKCTRRMYREILKHYGLKPKRVDRLVEKEIQMTGGYMETRHPDISALFARYIERDYDFETEEILRDFLELCFSPDAPGFFWNWRERERFIVQKIILKAREFPELFDYAFTLFAESSQPNSNILVFFLNVARDPAWQHKLCVAFYEKHYLNRKRVEYPNFWFRWGKIEESLANIGNVEKEYSARWIYRQGTEEAPTDGPLWRAWGLLEEALKHYGASVEDAYSARWIYRQGTEEAPTDGPLWRAWGLLEEALKHYGADVKDEYSARWIYRQGTEKAPTDGAPWTAWGQLEEKLEHYGASVEDEYSARWIYRQATVKAPTNGAHWRAWGQLEEKLGHYGASVEDAYSARWIYRQGTEKAPTHGAPWTAWGQLEEKLGHYGASVEEAYSARWIYRQASFKASFDKQIWDAWITYELTVPNRTRGFEIPYTAEWLAETGYRSNQNTSLLLNAVCLAISGGEYDKARKLLAEYANQTPGNILNAKQQADNLDNWYSLDYGFYICCKLSGMETEADAIAQAFASADVEMSSVKARCQEIWPKYPVYAPLTAWMDANP